MSELDGAKEGLEYSNYCAAFLDLLGQRDAMRGQGLLLIDDTGEPNPSTKEAMRKSVQQILSFQTDTEVFLNVDYEPHFPDELSADEKTTLLNIHTQKMKRQRWSDGLVLYASMNAIAPMNAIYEVMYASTCLCFQQLAKKAPIRGGLDVSWGAELHENELYGAIVANSYALESDIAQIPRVVVGDRLLQYLDAAVTQADESKIEDRMNKALAQFCQSILLRDLDGYVILDYMGPRMQEALGSDVFPELRRLALQFAHEQYEHYRLKERNSKLASRYNWLVSYLEQERSA